MLSFLVSCGDLKSKKKDKKQISIKQLAVCDMDVQRIKKILTARIANELECVQQNLNLFIDVVKSDRPGFLSLKELKGYIDVHIVEVDQDTMNLLDQVFVITALLYGDDNHFISKESVAKLVSLLDYINEQFVESSFYEFFTYKGPELSYKEHNRRKARIFAAFARIGKRINSDIKVKGNLNYIHIMDFLWTFHTEENKEQIFNMKKLLFLKKLFLGGKEEFLTAKEIKRLATMFGDISKIAYDLFKISEVAHLESQEEEIIKTLKEDVESLMGHIFYKRFDIVKLFNIYNIFDLVEYTMPELKRFFVYKKEILKLKEILLDTKSAGFTPNELYTLLDDIVLNSLKKGVFFYRAFSMNKFYLGHTEPISNGIKNTFYMSDEEKSYAKEFNQIVRNYRFFKGIQVGAVLDHRIRRSPMGILELSVFEKILKKVMAYYGDKKPSAKGGYSMNLDQMVMAMKDFEEFLIKQNVVHPGYLADTAKTVTLVGSLFQGHSDGDGDIELDEMTELAITINTAINVSLLFHDKLKTVCKLDNKNRYTPNCFRRHFKMMMSMKDSKGNKVHTYFPLLYQYLISMNYSGRLKYYKATEKFTRSCTHFDDESEVPMGAGDILSILGGMMAIENIIIRYDLNRNNKLEPNEVEKAYGNYALAIKGIIPVDFLKGYSKDFFLYLMKNRRLPDVQDVDSIGEFFTAVGDGAGFAWFIAFGDQKSTVSRDTLTVVLKTISDASKETPFPCEELR